MNHNLNEKPKTIKHQLDGITDSIDMSLNNFWEIVKNRETCMLQSMGSQRVRHNLGTGQQQQQHNTSKRT